MMKRAINRFVDFVLDKRKKHRQLFRVAAIAIFILPITIVSIFSYVELYRDHTDSALERRESVAKLAAIAIKEKFDGLENLGLSLATRVRFRQLISVGRWEDAIRIMREVPIDFPFIERVFIADPSGVLKSDFPELEGVRGRDFSFRDWYVGVIQSQAPYVSEIYKRTAQPQYNVIAVAVPIKSLSDNLAGILGMQIRLDTLLEWSKTIVIGEKGFVYFVDKKGNIGGHPKYPTQGELVNLSNLPVIKKLLGGGTGVEVAMSPIEDEENLVAYASVENYGWGVIAQEPTRLAFSVRNRDLVMISLFYALLFLLNLAIAILFLRIFHEVNEYRQREKVCLESVGDGLVSIDRNWNITLWNKAAADISGWSKEEAMGRHLRDVLKFIRERDRSENVAFIDEAMVYGRVGYLENNTLLVKKDGSEIPVGDSASPIFGSDGKVSGAMVIFRDVSMDKEAQLIRSDFAYASHQIRTPTTKALWSIELALEDKNPKSKKENLLIAYQSLQSVNKLTDHLLALSDVEAGKIIPKISPVNLEKIIERAKEFLKNKLTEKKIAVSIFGPVKTEIKSDEQILQKAVMEILDNALEYSPPKSEIKINIVPQENNLVIEVQDFGIGILSSQQSLIFTRFFRGTNVDTTKSAGSGLGLYLAKEYVKLLNGKIWFKSEEGMGTTIFLSLPR